MSEPEPLFRNVSDTALWAAMYRARETERKDALFRDPLARRLAGVRGERIFSALPAKDQHSWAWVMRTVLFDRYITEQVAQGVDLIVNLAAGLDARPYRMDLPPSLRWVEVDLPGLIDYKEEVLRGEKPVCELERVRLDLSDVEARRALFQELDRKATKAMILSEGLIIYLTTEEVASLARDLAAPRSFQRWATDLASPGLVKMLSRQKVGTHLVQASAPLQFGPPEKAEFFVPYGWRPAQVLSMFHSAAKAKRLPLWMRFFAMLPERKDPTGKQPWSAVCLLEKAGA